MDDFIKRSDAQKVIETANSMVSGLLEATMKLCVTMDRIAAADVAPVVHGKWIPDYDYTEYDYDGSTPLPEPRKFQDGWQCSLCGGYMPSETNFCPNCGARIL